MNDFLLLTKISIQQTFSLTKNNNSKFKSERRKKSLKTLGVTLIVGYILVYVYLFARSLMPAFIEYGKPLYVLGFLFTICSVYIFFMNIFKVKSVLFDFKDYDLLMSLPVKRNVVIASKIASQYVINLLCTFIIMIPGYVAYITYVDLPSDLLFFLLLFAIPIIPILASTIIGTILAWLTSFFRNKNIGGYIVNFSLIIIVLFISFKANNINEAEMVNQSINIVDSFSHYYPFASLFVNLLGSFTFINLLTYFLVPVILILIYLVFVNIGYIPLRNRLLRQNVKSDYEIEGYKSKSPLFSLYKKEIKKYFSNSLYVINTSFGCIVLIILILSLLLFNDSVTSAFDKTININEIIMANIYLILSVVLAVSSTTNSSISLEGKSLWIMKSIPASVDQIFLSKVMVNLTILIPTVIIGGTFFGIYLHAPLLNFILLYLMPLAYALFAALNGLLLNLMFPKFDYSNEIRVIKQSLAVFLSILIGIIVVIVPLNVFNNSTLSLVIITSIIFLIDILLVITLHFYGKRKFIRL